MNFVIDYLLSIAWLIWMVATWRSVMVKGTRARFILAGLDRAFRYPALAYPIFNLYRGLVGEWTLAISFVTPPVLIGLWVMTRYVQRRNGSDDDDDFWPTLGRRLRGFVQRFRPGPTVAGAPA